LARLEGKVALVSGASRGIGYQTALALGREGAEVIAIARTVGALEELDDAIRLAGGKPATLVPFDLTDYEAIDRLGASIFEKWGKLDIWVSCAATLQTLCPVEHATAKDFDKTFALNATGNWRQMVSYSELLRRSDGGRALVLFNGEAAAGKNFWGVYGASQAAAETLTTAWAGELAHTGTLSGLVDPGPTRTALRARAMPGEDTSQLSDPADVAQALLEIILDETLQPAFRHNLQSR